MTANFTSDSTPRATSHPNLLNITSYKSKNFKSKNDFQNSVTFADTFGFSTKLSSVQATKLIKFVTYIDGLVKNGKACAKNGILKVTFTLIW